jgi:hypothetical protein
MRRKDKEITAEVEIKAILAAECIFHVAMIDAEEPYLIALNYGFDGTALYFHSGLEGRKMKLFLRPQGTRVCFMVDRFQGILERQTNSPVPTFTSQYRSVIGWGSVKRETDPDLIRRGLNLIILQATQKMTYYHFSSCQEKTALFRLDIETMTGKQSPMD